MLNLNDLILALTNHEITPLDVCFSGAVIDSRQAVEGSLFIALPGKQVDGHNFVQAAFDKGAVLAIIERDVPEIIQQLDLRIGHFDPILGEVRLPLCLRVDSSLEALQTIASFWRNKHPLRTIGITGSVGKTSTKELTAFLLSRKFSVLKNFGNRNNEIGLPLTLLELESHHEYAVLEMGFYVPGEIRTLCQIAHPHVGVITNIGTVHAERAGSQEIIAKGKAELVESLPEAPEGMAILNRDDPWVRRMEEKTRAGILTYGIKEEAHLTATQIKTHGLEGISCTLNFQSQSHQVRSPLLGEFSVYTILRAAAVALVEGFEWETIIEGLADGQIEQRMRQSKLPNSAIILDDTYNASPASTTAALEFLAGLDGRRIAILGDMLELGPYEESGHQAVGIAAASAADVLILVGHRSKMIAETALKNGLSEQAIHWFPDSAQASKPAASIIKAGDIVLVKGSNSMHMDRIMAAIEESV